MSPQALHYLINVEVKGRINGVTDLDTFISKILATVLQKKGITFIELEDRMQGNLLELRIYRYKTTHIDIGIPPEYITLQ